MTEGKQVSRTEYIIPKIPNHPCVKLVRTVQKEEWINTFLIEITLNPKITNGQLAEKFHCHTNTVSKYRKIIRERQLRTNLELVNKIDNILEDRLPDMEDHDLINYRKAIAPAEVKMEVNENLTVNQRTTEITQVLHEHAILIREESERRIQANCPREPMDTANPPNPTT